MALFFRLPSALTPRKTSQASSSLFLGTSCQLLKTKKTGCSDLKNTRMTHARPRKVLQRKSLSLACSCPIWAQTRSFRTRSSTRLRRSKVSFKRIKLSMTVSRPGGHARGRLSSRISRIEGTPRSCYFSMAMLRTSASLAGLSTGSGLVSR